MDITRRLLTVKKGNKIRQNTL